MMALGNFGNHKAAGHGVQELRIDYGPGYRIYYIQQGKLLVILLCGGDKGTQRKDINAAQKLAASL
jgi:putative addiction module killer protein